MSLMSEILSGEGLLEEWNNPDATYAVEYRFVIADTHNSGLGRIVAATPFPLASGIYRLQTQDGTAIKVRHGGSGIWTVLRR
jgi:hypothetical protein